ncbi:hypothetical protein EJ110_NYTH34617 [Nymphaea thermarum]|nr:hypothetical protein EJ110_NYTH34617 [Nymphaea thermarum]
MKSFNPNVIRRAVAAAKSAEGVGLIDFEPGAQSVLKECYTSTSMQRNEDSTPRGSGAAADATEMDDEPGNNNGTFVAARGRVISQVEKSPECDSDIHRTEEIAGE